MLRGSRSGEGRSRESEELWKAEPEEAEEELKHGKRSGGNALRGNTRTHPEHVVYACVDMLSLKRPMILYWRRYGKAGGCRIIKRSNKKWKQRPVRPEGA